MLAKVVIANIPLLMFIPCCIFVKWIAILITSLIKSSPSTFLTLFVFAMAKFSHALKRTVPELLDVSPVRLFVIDCISRYLLPFAVRALTVWMKS